MYFNKMVLRLSLRKPLLKFFKLNTTNRYFNASCVLLNNQTQQPPIMKPPTSAMKPSASTPSVPGLSNAVLTTQEPVGPGASKDGVYKVPEYFNYNTFSYFEAEVEMEKFRLQQPSALSQ